MDSTGCECLSLKALWNSAFHSILFSVCHSTFKSNQCVFLFVYHRRTVRLNICLTACLEVKYLFPFNLNIYIRCASLRIILCPELYCHAYNLSKLQSATLALPPGFVSLKLSASLTTVAFAIC